MYFPSAINPQPNGYIPQSQPTTYPQHMIFSQTQQAANPFMYPTKLQPYNDREFLCKTFNYRVPFIEAFLSLSHEEKLQFFLICQSRRLTGELTDKETYSRVLEKIMGIVNPNYQKTQQEYKPISDEELKKKILEKEFEQKCEWELRKLGMGEESVSVKQNLESGRNFSGNGLSMNFDEFDFMSPNKIQDYNVYEQKISFSQNKEVANLSQNKQDDDDQLVFDDEVQYNESSSSYQDEKSQNQPSLSVSPTLSSSTSQQFATRYTDQQQYQPTFKQQPNQDEQWQEAEQIISPNIFSTNPQIINPSIKEQKVASIWDLQINEEEIKKSEPDIKEIFGLKSGDDDFGGFEEANVEVLSGGANVSSFLKQNEFRYETVAEVSNDWLLGGTNHHLLADANNSVGYMIEEKPRDLIDGGDFSVAENKQNTDKLSQNIEKPSWVFDEQLHLSQPCNNQLKFDINSFDINSLMTSYQNPSPIQKQPFNPNSSMIHDFQSSTIPIAAIPSPDLQMDVQSLNFSSNLNAQSEFYHDSVVNYQQQHFQKQQEDDEQWEEGEEIVSEPQQFQVISQPHHQHQDTPLSYDLNFSHQAANHSLSYDPFSNIQETQIQHNLANTTLTNNPINTSFPAQPSIIPPLPSQPTTKNDMPYPTISQTQPKSIKKIMKPPSMKNIHIQESNFSHFVTKNDQIQNLNHQELKVNKVVQPRTKLSNQLDNQENFSSVQSPKVQNNLSSAFAKKSNLSAQTALNLSIVPSINIAVASSTHLPPDSSLSASSNKIPQQMSMSTCIPSKIQLKQQKIISTYNKQVSYTPNTLRSSIKSMLAKSKTFFKQNKQRSSTEIREIAQQNNQIQQHSMMDVDYGKNRDFLTGSHKVSMMYSPKVGGKGFSSMSKLDYSIDAHMIDDLKNDEFGNDASKEEEFNDVERLNSAEERFSRVVFAKKAILNQEDHAQSLIEKQQDAMISSGNQIEDSLEDIQFLISLSKDFMLRLAQNEINYLKQQLQKNKFFFDKQFYIRLKQTIQQLSLSKDLGHFFKSFSRSSIPPSYQPPQYPSHLLFSTELTFITQIIEKLQKIEELNKKFTLAMEEDQEEELAEVVMKSKQLTFEVNEDGDVVKRIAGLVLDGRLDGSVQEGEEIDQETEKYKGLYYVMVKLIMKQQPNMHISPLPEQQLMHLKKLYKDASSYSLSSKSHFLSTCTVLYLLHSQLNQLQYIKNISLTIFGYFIKQHSLLITKINKIKLLSNNYAEPPQTIFGKLMQSDQMVNYLKGLGEMAGVVERLCQLGKFIGVRFEREEFSYEKLAKTITEARQLSLKYNLFNNSLVSSTQQTSYHPYLALILSMITSGKSASQISSEMRNLLKQNPICKVCLAPRNPQNNQQGDYISNAVPVSSESLRSRDTIEWCHFACYNMLKMAFEEANDHSAMEGGQ